MVGESFQHFNQPQLEVKDKNEKTSDKVEYKFFFPLFIHLIMSFANNFFFLILWNIWIFFLWNLFYWIFLFIWTFFFLFLFRFFFFIGVCGSMTLLENRCGQTSDSEETFFFFFPGLEKEIFYFIFLSWWGVI